MVNGSFKVLWIFKNMFELFIIQMTVIKKHNAENRIKNSNWIKRYASFKIMQISI